MIATKIKQLVIENPAIKVRMGTPTSPIENTEKDISKKKNQLKELNADIDILILTKNRLKEDIQKILIEKDSIKEALNELNKNKTEILNKLNVNENTNELALNLGKVIKGFTTPFLNSLKNGQDLTQQRRQVEDEREGLMLKTQMEVELMKKAAQAEINKKKADAENELQMITRQKQYISNEVNTLLQKYVDIRKGTIEKAKTPVGASVGSRKK